MAESKKTPKKTAKQPEPPVKPSRRKLFTIVSVLAILTGLYLLAITWLIPGRAPLDDSAANPANAPERQLIIPRIGVNAAIVPFDIKQLDKGLIGQRTQSLGDPRLGGNFVLTGHRFVFNFNPVKVRKQSVLYDLDKLKTGDRLTVYWDYKRYDYEVSRLYEVKPNQVEIEEPSEEAKLTLYTCTLGGAYDGRVVVVAKPK